MSEPFPPEATIQVHAEWDHIIDLPNVVFRHEEGDLDFHEIGLMAWLIASKVTRFTIPAIVALDRYKDEEKTLVSLRALVKAGLLSFRVLPDDEGYEFTVVPDIMSRAR